MLQEPLTQLLFIDIETVSAEASFDKLSADWQQLWAKKSEKLLPEGETAHSFYPKRAAIMAEFGKVICVSIGYLKREGQGLQLRVKSFWGNDEAELLRSLMPALDQLQAQLKGLCFCGHNIREFDVPYLCRRLLANGMAIPDYLNFQAMKPWETNLVDTLQLWKFGDHKHFTSLALLAATLGITSPKDDIDGSQVGEVYWQQNDLPRIVTYCQKDVITVAQVLLRLRQMPLLAPEQVVLVNAPAA